MLLALLEEYKKVSNECIDLRKKILSFNNKEWQNILYELGGREYEISLHIVASSDCPFTICIKEKTENKYESYKLYANLRVNCEVLVNTSYCLHIAQILEIVYYFEEKLVDLLKY